MNKLQKVFLIIISIFIVFIGSTFAYFKLKKNPTNINVSKNIANETVQNPTQTPATIQITTFGGIKGSNLVILFDNKPAEYPINNEVKLYCAGSRLSGLETAEIAGIEPDKVVGKDELANVIKNGESITALHRTSPDNPQGVVWGIIYNCK